MRTKRMINGDKLLQWRDKNDKTQDQLSQMSGVTRAAIAQIERYVTLYPTKETVDRLAEAMNVSAETLYLSDEEAITRRETSNLRIKKPRGQKKSGSDINYFEKQELVNRFLFSIDGLPQAVFQGKMALASISELKERVEEIYSELERDLMNDLEPQMDDQALTILKKRYDKRFKDALKFEKLLKELEPKLRKVSTDLNK